MMEEHKLRYLKSVLERGNENVEIYVEAMKSLEETARKCYVELPKLNTREFIQMLILDGCFIVELLHKFDDPCLRDENDPIFAMEWILDSLKRDLMLFENQIPFFVLGRLFNMIKVPNQGKTFNEFALTFFCALLPGPGHLELADDSGHDQTRNLLRMIHDNWLPPFAEIELSTDAIRKQRSLKLIYCATELIEVGVKFEKAEEGTCLLDIRFRDGTMQIPPLIVEDRTECFLKNLIVYEQCCQDIHKSDIISYTQFLNCLIDSLKDVEILYRYGIIDNWFGDDETVSKIFNKIKDSIIIPNRHFHYIDIFDDVNARCSKRVNRWMAKWRRKYLNSPRGVISILAAFALLLLTLIQSVFAIIVTNFDSVCFCYHCDQVNMCLVHIVC